MPREVPEHVSERVCCFPRTLERVCVVPIRKHLAPTLHQPIQRARDAYRQSLNAAREPHGVFGSHDQVKVVRLYAEVDESEPGTSLSVRESARDGAKAPLAA